MLTDLDGVFIGLYGTLTVDSEVAIEAVCQQVVRDTGLSLSALRWPVWASGYFFWQCWQQC